MKTVYALFFGLLLSGCVGMPHGDPQPEVGYGGYAEWRWPYQTPGESWADQMPHPDKVPTGFRTAQVRLTHMREGCAQLLFPAYVTVAQRQYNKALRAFAAEYYDDAFVDLKALNNQLDEIDRRLEIAGAAGGCQQRRNRYNDGHWHGLHGHCSGHCGHGTQDCGHTGAEFNCAAGDDSLRKPGCGMARPCSKGKTSDASCAHGQCPRHKPQSHHAAVSSPSLPAGFRAPETLFLRAQFPYNSDRILPEYQAYLEQLAAKLQQRGHPRLMIQGHASAEGSEDYNRALAQRRAESVQSFLAARGVPMARMSMISFGEAQPTESNSTEQGRAANRRVEIYVKSGSPEHTE